MSLRHLTISSLAMSSVTILRMLVQLMVLPVLARYLTPADYGIVALAMPFVIFAMSFSDAGMSASLIRTTSHNKTEWSTSFWLVAGLGAALTCIIAVIGYVVSLYLKEPLLAPIVGALSLTVLLQAIATVPGAKLQQSGKFPIIAGIEMIAMTISLFGTVTAAVYGWGAWALVVQQVLHYIVKLLLTLIHADFLPNFEFRLSIIKEHLVFGRDMLGINILTFIRQSVGNMIIGKVLGTSTLGVYAMSSMFAELPMRIVSGPLYNVLYPRIAALRDRKEVIRVLFLMVSRVISLLLIPAISLVAIAHEPIFHLLLSEKWQQAGNVFMWMAPAAIISSITCLRGIIAVAFGHTGIWLRQATETTILFTLALVLSVTFGIEWVAIGYTIAVLLYMPRSLLEILPLIDLKFIEYIKTIIIPTLITIVSLAVYVFIAATFTLSYWALFAIAFVLGLVTVAISGLIQMKDIKWEIKYLRQNIEVKTEPSVLA